MSSTLEYKNIIADMRTKVNNELEIYFNEKLNQCDDDKIINVISELKSFTMNGGKRVRPILMIIGHNLFRRQDDKIIKASISIELAQSFLLIHDDIMDSSDFRRGKPSYHKAIESKLSVPERAKIAENVAISAGDLVDTFSHEALLISGFDVQNLLDADFEFSRIIEDTGKGQLLDIYSSIENSYSEQNLLKLHFLKTARYTIQGPLLMGAYLSGNKEYISNLKDFGKYAGIAFQLYDDVLGLFGDESKTGKPSKGDVNDGKKTLLMIRAYENSDSSKRSFIEKCLKSGNVSDSDFEELKNIVKESGSYDYSMNKIKEYNKLALAALDGIHGDKSILELLNFFLGYLTNREN
ncbi:MAG: polyprenyl synthetase family protein [Ferroplasma sp.]